MAIEVLLVQFLVLVFTGALWWIARRDLAGRAIPPVELPSDTQELEQLCATLEALVTDLARRLESVERQAAARQSMPDESPLPSFSEVGALLSASAPSLPETVEAMPAPPVSNEPPLPSFSEVGALLSASMPPETGVVTPALPPLSVLTARSAPVMATLSPAVSPWSTDVPEAAPDEDPLHAVLHALWEQGVTDPVELARRTGLGRGEVDLLLSLRGRRAL